MCPFFALTRPRNSVWRTRAASTACTILRTPSLTQLLCCKVTPRQGIYRPNCELSESPRSSCCSELFRRQVWKISATVPTPFRLAIMGTGPTTNQIGGDAQQLMQHSPFLTARLATDYCMVPWFHAGAMILSELTQYSNVQALARSATSSGQRERPRFWCWRLLKPDLRRSPIRIPPAGNRRPFKFE